MRNFIRNLIPKIIVSAIGVALLLLFLPDAREDVLDALSGDSTEPAVSAEEEPDTLPEWDYYNPDQQLTDAAYVLNRRSRVFHVPSCSAVARIAPVGYATSNASRDDLIADGYRPCGLCDP